MATAAISAINLLVSLADLGLGVAMIRFAAPAGEKATEIINTCIAIGWLAAAVLSCLFLLGIPLWASGLSLIRQAPGMATGFVVFAVCWSVLSLQTSAMLARRQALFMFLRYILSSVLSLVLIGVLLKVCGGYAVALLAYNLPVVFLVLISSVFVLPRFFRGYRPLGHLNLAVTWQLARYAGVNHLAGLLWSVPLSVLPLVAASALSLKSAAYFYVPWMTGNSVLSITRAVSVSLFTEGSFSEAAFGRTIKRASLVTAATVLPAAVVLGLWGDVLLGVFGEGYVDIWLLRVVLASVVPFSINSITFVVLRVLKHLKELVALSAFIAASCVVGAYVLAPLLGGIGLALGWLGGHTLASAAILILIVLKGWRTRVPSTT
jgi:O-antigen/teichoic acid export membrane protein